MKRCVRACVDLSAIIGFATWVSGGADGGAGTGHKMNEWAPDISRAPRGGPPHERPPPLGAAAGGVGREGAAKAGACLPTGGFILAPLILAGNAKANDGGAVGSGPICTRLTPESLLALLVRCNYAHCEAPCAAGSPKNVLQNAPVRVIRRRNQGHGEGHVKQVTEHRRHTKVTPPCPGRHLSSTRPAPPPASAAGDRPRRVGAR